jgi:uncharacterized membrane protein YhiD involved in acid resistance
MSIIDAIKKSALEGFSSEITVPDIIFSVGIAFIVGLFILLIYRLTYKGVSFSRSFEGTLLMVSTVSALIVLTITSNLALSLGMVGALSIVRFRTAIKDASDTAFMFWAVAVGVTAGAHYYVLTIVGSLLIGFLTYSSLKIIGRYDPSFLLIIRATTDKALDYAGKMLAENGYRHRLTSINSTDQYNEVIYEISVGSEQSKLVSALKNIPDITDVNLVDCRNSPI